MNICVLDVERVCTGCGRTLDEIARWGRMSSVDQWAVIARLERARTVAVAADGVAAR
jgi:predicted Fe-S protein YdhL (DUF1289 family)